MEKKEEKEEKRERKRNEEKRIALVIGITGYWHLCKE